MLYIIEWIKIIHQSLKTKQKELSFELNIYVKRRAKKGNQNDVKLPLKFFTNSIIMQK